MIDEKQFPGNDTPRPPFELGPSRTHITIFRLRHCCYRIKSVQNFTFLPEQDIHNEFYLAADMDFVVEDIINLGSLT